MPKLKDLTKVDSDYPTVGPNQKTLVQAINVPSTTLFNCLADGPAWSEWLGIEVEWTTPEPRDVGTTRTVTTKGQQIDEFFFTWDEGERMGFRFDRTTLPVSAFAELYECVPTGANSCELRWSYAFEWGGPLAPVFGKAFAAGFAFNSTRALKKLAAMLENDSDRFA